MNKIIPVLASALVLAACSSDDSTGPSGPRGEQKYSRTLTKGDAASMECKVYASDNSVTIMMSMDLTAYNSTMTTVLETTLGSESSSYVADVEMTGVLQSQVSEGCQETKDGLAAQGGVVTCTESTVHAVLDLPGVTSEAHAQTVINRTVQEGISQCDDFYKSSKETFVEFPGEWGGDVDGVYSAEKANSCDVNLDNGVLTVEVVYPAKSARVQVVAEGDLFTVSETYTGLDASTLYQICANYSNDSDNIDVSCMLETFKYSVAGDGASLEDLAVYQQKTLCPALLSGEMSLESMWSE